MSDSMYINYIKIVTRMKYILLLLILVFAHARTDEIVLGEDDLIDVDLSYIDSPLIDIVWCG